MDGKIHKSEGTGEHIWLTYATQITTGGRTHTIEMSIPMPVGASAETREQLIREAEAGMSQLLSHVENRLPQMLQRAQAGQGTPSSSASMPNAVPQPKPTVKPASLPAPQTSAQPAKPVPAQSREMGSEQGVPQSTEVMVPPTRQNIAASMPHSTGPAGDRSGNLLLPQFIQYIKENMGLTPKQAMDLLKVKSLSTGINLRDALERLQHLVSQDTTGTTEQEQKPQEAEKPELTVRPDSEPTPISTRRFTNTPVDEPEREVVGSVREIRSVYVFDEEVGPEDVELEEEEQEDDLEDLEDLEEARELTAQERVRARTLLNRLREARGPTTASPSRLQALHNVADSQVSKEQLQELIEGVWQVTSLKKLKVDQVEALISWAKEDDFMSEVDAILALLEEEYYARGNR